MTLADAAHITSCILLALLLRLLAAFLVALANELSLKESLFIAVTWMPKAIVEVSYVYDTVSCKMFISISFCT